MASIEKVKGSNGSGNANVATVQSLRSPGASSIIVDTVLDINPGGFTGSMGTPHTFTDPITSEVITVISEASAVDFIGHITSGHIEIDTIAPGYTDLGSKVGDIVVVRPTTQYADNLAAVLAASLNDDGTLKTGIVATAKIADNAVDYTKVANGVPIGHASTIPTASSTTTTQLPFDDTIPQNTEGAEVMTLSYTPKLATSILKIEVKLQGSSDTASRNISAALFKDTTADALAAASQFNSSATLTPSLVTLTHTMVAGGTTAITFKVRAGLNNTGTLTFNGFNGSRVFGAIPKSSIVITEIKA